MMTKVNGMTLYKRIDKDFPDEKLVDVKNLGEELTRTGYDPAEELIKFATNNFGNEIVPIGIRFKAAEIIFSRMFPSLKAVTLSTVDTEQFVFNMIGPKNAKPQGVTTDNEEETKLEVPDQIKKLLPPT